MEGEPQSRLFEALHFTVAQIASERSRASGTGRQVSKCFVHSLAHVVQTLAEHLARDTEMFAAHAKRSTVQVSDVLLAARRNDELKAVLEHYAETNKLAVPRQTSRKRAAPDAESGGATTGPVHKKRKAKKDGDADSEGGKGRSDEHEEEA